MTYRQLIKKVQTYSGFSDRESEDSLRLIVETLSLGLHEDEREDFASELPSELQSSAMIVSTTSTLTMDEVYDELSEIEGIDRNRVKQQLLAVWKALKDIISPGQIKQLSLQLPHDLLAELH